MGLGCQVIELVRLDLLNDVNETGGIGEIAMVEKKPFVF